MSENSKRIEIFGTPMDQVTQRDVLHQFQRQLSSDNGSLLHLSTVNTEFIMQARNNESFRETLNRTDLNVPDGAGVVWAMNAFGGDVKERVTGVDLLSATCELAAKQDASVFLLGAAPGIAEKASEKLQEQIPQLTVAGTYSGSPAASEAEKIITMINKSRADILFIAYSAPDPDRWIHQYKQKLTTVKIAFGVGGSFDFIAGMTRRAPEFIQNNGLEWLWRLIQEPKRIKRQLVIPHFIYLVLLHRLRSS